jgi:hypothetical protein
MIYRRKQNYAIEISIWAIVGFEVVTAVIMKTFLVLVKMWCSLLKVNGSFGGSCSLYLTSVLIV